MLDKTDIAFLESEIKLLLSKRVIVPCSHDPVEFFSPIFPVYNSDDSVRMILNLKHLNTHITYHHFKMDTIHTVLENITPHCYMASIDLKSAYYSVPIHEEYQKYLKFTWAGHNYKFVCFPNGLSPCPRRFTKITKVPLSYLRDIENIIISGYLDDFHLQGADYDTCAGNVLKAVTLFDKLGFVIHPDKSALIPVQEIKYLGFLINSVTMTITLTPDKKVKLHSFISTILGSHKIKIRKIACLIGKLVSCLPATSYGALYYRNVEVDKIKALKANFGDFDKIMTLSVHAKHDLQWWLINLPTLSAPIQLMPITLTMSCDASNTGWGAVLQSQTAGGAWTPTEQELHINCKEMLAVYYGLRSFSQHLLHLHVRILSDNTTTVSVINSMGTVRSHRCNFIAQQIWEVCKNHDIWVTCAHIPGSANTASDLQSRKEYKQAEWMLNPTIFKKATHKFAFYPDLDCFASRLNTQLDSYVSFQPDPYAKFVDSFSLNWADFNCYLFPPFSLIGRVLQKIRVDGATALCVFPRWPTQPWWPLLKLMLIKAPWVLRPSRNNLLLPQKHEEIHPLSDKLKLMICVVSGRSSLLKGWKRKQ